MKQVTDTLVFVLDPLSENARKEPILILYKHFPSSIEPSELQELLHWVFSICGLRTVKTDKFGFWLDFSFNKVVEDFYKYKASIDKRYNELPEKEPVKETSKDSLLMQKSAPDLSEIEDLRVGELAAFNDGSIRYKGTPIEMRGQLKELCRYFMGRRGRLVTIDEIKEEIIHSDKRKTTSNTTLAKYVSELRNSLKSHLKKNVIFSQKDEGWFFRL